MRVKIKNIMKHLVTWSNNVKQVPIREIAMKVATK